jgi:hypothetical protein
VSKASKYVEQMKAWRSERPKETYKSCSCGSKTYSKEFKEYERRKPKRIDYEGDNDISASVVCDEYSKDEYNFEVRISGYEGDPGELSREQLFLFMNWVRDVVKEEE